MTTAHAATPHIAKFIVNDTAEGYFAARLSNGSVRVGLLGCECFDFDQTHAEFTRISNLDANTVEATHDEFMGKYVCAALAKVSQ